MAKQVKKKKIFGLNVKEFLLSVVLPVGTCLIGVVVSLMLGLGGSILVKQNAIGGGNQKRVMKLPYVKAYTEFLHKIETKSFDEVWDMMSPELRGVFRNKENVEYSYYLTNSYKIKYIIPIADKQFYAFVDFDDLVEKGKEDREIRTFLESAQIVSTKSGSVTKMGVEDYFNQGYLTQEVYEFLSSRFEIPDEAKVKTGIDSLMRRMSMTDYVTHDWRTPIIVAQKLGLKPKGGEGVNVENKESHQMVQKVHMEKYDNEWKVKEMHTELLSRWKK